MSDEVATSAEVALLPSADAGQAATSETAPSTSDSGGSAVKQTSEQGKPAKVNLNDLPEFRTLKSQWDQREAQYQRQVSQLSEAQEAAKLAGMNEGQRNAYLVDKYKNAAELAMQEAQNLLMEQQRKQDIADLNAEFGVPVDVLENAANYAAAKKLAEGWKAQVRAAAREFEEKVQRNAPETGGGGNAKSTSQKDVRVQQAVEAKDPLAILDAYAAR